MKNINFYTCFRASHSFDAVVVFIIVFSKNENIHEDVDKLK